MKLSAKLSIALLVATMAFSAIGCKGNLPDPPVKPGVEQTAQNGGKISVDSFILTTPDFIDRDGKAQRTVKEQGEVAILRLRISNPTGSDIKYKPLHFKNAGERIQICTDPDKETGARSNVSAIAFDIQKMIHTPKQHIEDQVTIPAGHDITDDYLFEVPMTSEKLVALVPGDILGDASSKVFRFYLEEPSKVAPQPPKKLNQPATVDDLMVTVTRVTTEYAELEERTPPAKPLKYAYAYTKKPVLSIYMTIKNTGKKPVGYDPSHSSAIPGINLNMQNIGLKRIKLESGVVGKGQVKGKVTIEPGATLTDVYFFEIPDSSGLLNFMISGHIFGVNGIYKFALDYLQTTPPEPDLHPYKNAGKEGAEGADDADAGDEGEEGEEEAAEGGEAKAE